jgi:hypothetical protein
MKSASDILKSIQNKPQFSKLSTYDCIKQIKNSFSQPLQKMIKFAYIKNETLFFVLNHPGAKQEFDNSIQSIKSALKYVKPKACQEHSFTDIKAFVSHTLSHTKEKNKTQMADTYKERALGNFTIVTQNQDLKNIFLEIQKIIKEKNGS